MESPLRSMAKVPGRRGSGRCRPAPVETSMRSSDLSMDREIAQPEEVHLEETQLLDSVHSYWVTMGRRRVVPVGLALHGDVLGQRLVGDDHRGGVDTVLRRRPSRPLATSMTLRASPSPSYMVRSSPAAAKPSSWPSVRVRQAARGCPGPSAAGHGLGDPVTDPVGERPAPGRGRAPARALMWRKSRSGRRGPIRTDRPRT